MKIKTKPAEPVTVKERHENMNSGPVKYERGNINRTYKIAVIKCRYVTSDLKKVKTGTFELPVKTLDQGIIIKMLSKQQNNIYIIKVISIKIRRVMYSMDEETFLKYAERKELKNE